MTSNKNSRYGCYDNGNYNKNHITKREKLPLKSINNRRCLTKCYPKNEHYLHPTILTVIAADQNSCAIDPTYSKNSNIIYNDICRLEDNKTYEPPNELESILLDFYFNPQDFLINMYNLYSFDQVIYWTLENDELPFDTIKRVHNCAWKAYGNKIENLSDYVLDYYYDLAKNHWMYDYIKLLRNKYSFNVTTNEINFKLDQDNRNIKSDLDTLDENITITLLEIYNIIINKFFDYAFFAKIVKKYVNTYKDIWDSIESHYGKLKNFVYNELLMNIEKKIHD